MLISWHVLQNAAVDLLNFTYLNDDLCHCLRTFH